GFEVFCVLGFDEYMNLVLDDAEEIHSKTKSRKQLGRDKGTVTLTMMQPSILMFTCS
uniref:Small nuclear ribonucleoprotein E n=1 Tax=Malurus cyaneus samueli TaxID=2593467 RepID=A0A8C5TUZ1_9PASS